MNNVVILAQVLLFLLFWLMGAICWFRTVMISSSLKKRLRRHHPKIRFVLGLSSINKMTIKTISKGSESLIEMFFLLGSRKSVLHYLNVFVDINAIYATNEKLLTSRLNQLIKFIGLSVKAFWGMLVSLGLVWVVSV